MNAELYKGDYRKVLCGVKANLILTSPPYNIGSKSPARTGRRANGGYDAKSYRAITDYPDEMSEHQYQDSQTEFLEWCEEHLADNGVIAYQHKPRRKRGTLIHPYSWIQRVPLLHLIDEIVWDRGSTHNHSAHMMWQQTERIYILQRRGDRLPRVDTNLEFRSDVWRISPAKPNGHNAPFPLLLACAVIKAYSKKLDLVCDPYAGSGTTGAAAVMTGRRFVGSERLAKYYKLAAKRIHRTKETC